MKTVFSLVLVLVLALPFSACAPKVNDPADVQAITVLVNNYAKAVNAKDVAASVAGMTAQARYYEPHMPPLVGKAAIEQFHRALFDQFDAVFNAPVVDVRVTGKLGVAQGTWTQKLTPKADGMAPITDSGNWTVVASARPMEHGRWTGWSRTATGPCRARQRTGPRSRRSCKMERALTDGRSRGTSPRSREPH